MPINNMIEFYYYLLDKKIQNGNLLVLIISSLIISTGIIFGANGVNKKEIVYSQKQMTTGKDYKVNYNKPIK